MEYDDAQPPATTGPTPGSGRPRPRHRNDRFDENGNPRSSCDPKGQTITSTFDELNRLEDEELRLRRRATRRGRGGTRRRSSTSYDAERQPAQTDEHVASGADPPATTLVTDPHLRRPRPADERDASRCPTAARRTVALQLLRNGLRKTRHRPRDRRRHRYAYDGQNRLADGDDGLRHAATPRPRATRTGPTTSCTRSRYPNGVMATHDYDKADRLAVDRQRQAAPRSSRPTSTPAPIRHGPAGLLRPERQPPHPGRDERRPDRDDDATPTTTSTVWRRSPTRRTPPTRRAGW